MRRIAFVLAFLWASVASADQFIGGLGGAGVATGSGGGGGFTPSCSQSAAYVAAAPSIASYPTFQSAMDTYICGMVTDGTFALIDHAFVFAAPTKAIALTDLVQSAPATPVVNGVPIFDPNVGVIFDGSAAYIDTGVVVSGTNYTQNSASAGICILSARLGAYQGSSTNTPSQVYGGAYAFGFISSGGTTNTYLSLVNSGTQSITIMNNNASGTTTYVTNSQGLWMLNRSGAGTNSVQLYVNGVAKTVNGSAASQPLPALDMFVGANNNNGVANKFTLDEVGFYFQGGSMNATQAGQMHTRLNALLTALLMPGYC